MKGLNNLFLNNLLFSIFDYNSRYR